MRHPEDVDNDMYVIHDPANKQYRLTLIIYEGQEHEWKKKLALARKVLEKEFTQRG